MPPRSSVRISASVGRNGVNRRDDVLTVQQLINDHLPTPLGLSGKSFEVRALKIPAFCLLSFQGHRMVHRVVMLVLVLASISGAVGFGRSAGVRAQEPAAAPHVWKTYTNVRFQYAICYPEDLLVPQGEPENGDGQKFLAKDGARLIVFGQNNALDQPLKEVLADTALRLASTSGKVTYKVLKGNWFVVSGQNGQTVFYAKTRYSHDQLKSFELTYDRAAVAVYEPLIGRFGTCFVDLAH